MTHDEEAERQRCRRLLGGAPIGFLLCGAGWVLVSAAADRNFSSRPARAGRSRRTARWPGRGARSRFTLGAWRSSSPRPSTGACGSACCWPVKPSAGCLGSSRSTRASSGRGAYGKTVVFGIFERQGHVYTEIVPDCSTPTLHGIIRGRVDHAREECTKGTVHITGIEGFWGLTKVRLTPFKGLPKHTFHLHLKETEWRYNHRRADKYKCLLQYLRKNPLS